MQVAWNVDRFVIDDATRARLQKIYQGFEAEILKMETWYLANPRKRKKNHCRFIVNWLNGEASKAGRPILPYRRQNEEFNEKFRQAVEEAAPPPVEWREMMGKLKRGAA